MFCQGLAPQLIRSEHQGQQQKRFLIKTHSRNSILKSKFRLRPGPNLTKGREETRRQLDCFELNELKIFLLCLSAIQFRERSPTPFKTSKPRFQELRHNHWPEKRRKSPKSTTVLTFMCQCFYWIVNCGNFANTTFFLAV
jgi:hypothetical protein